MSALSKSLFPSYTSKVFDKCVRHQRKGFRRMPFRLMTHTASSLKHLSNESGEHLPCRMVSQYGGADSTTAARATHSEIIIHSFIFPNLSNYPYQSGRQPTLADIAGLASWISLQFITGHTHRDRHAHSHTYSHLLIY